MTKQKARGRRSPGWVALAAVVVVAAALSSRPDSGAGAKAPAPAVEAGAGSGAARDAGIPGTLQATVKRVVDGDTLDVLVDGREERVRLIGVDTPEVYGKAEAYGAEASAFTKERLTGQEVRLELDAEERDRYGRLLAYVWIGDEMFNETLVREGYAQVMTVPPNVKYADRFVALQREARENGRGLWGLEEEAGADGSAQEASGSVLPVNGDCGGLIKGNISSSGERIYHVPGGQFYERTYAEACFATPEEAEAAGYRRSRR